MLSPILKDAGDSKSVLMDILAECYNSLETTAKVLFPEMFYRPFSEKIHKRIFEILDNPDIQRVAIAAPRGTGKTSIMNVLLPAHQILFNERDFIVPVSATGDVAMQQSENLKKALLQNENVRKLFGNLRSDDVFAKKAWRANNKRGTYILPRGAGQQVRGINFESRRPDLIIVDDLEKAKAVKSELQREDLKKWFFSDLMDAVQHDVKWRVVVLGTVLSQDALLVELLDDPDWESAILELCDDNLESNWPEFKTTEQIRQEYEMAKRRHVLETFYAEKRNIGMVKELSPFKAEYFRYFEKNHEFNAISPYEVTFVLVDPAKTVNKRSDETGLVVWTVDFKANRMYVRCAYGEHLHPEQIYDRAIDLAILYKAPAIWCEVTGLDEFITGPFKQRIQERAPWLRFEVLKPRGGVTNEEGKEGRIASLLSFYRDGRVFHHPTECVKLEEQLIAFPYSKKKDVMDAAAYIVQAMERCEAYFSPLEEGDGLYPDEEEEKALEQLFAEEERPITGWRVV